MSDMLEVYRDDRPTVIVKRSRDRRRINDLEERLLQQEKTTHALIERAYELKEKLGNKIQPSSMDAALQQLWHEHIRTITSTVKQLSRDLDAVKYEISVRDSHAQNANFQTKSVEQFAQAGVADLRGRVVRCDTSIAKLASDIHSVTTVSQMEADKWKQAAETNKSKAQEMENQLSLLTKRIDYLVSEQEGKIQTIQGSSSKQMEAIDSRIKRILEDIRMTAESNKRWAEGERNRIEQQIMQIIELNSSIAQTKQESFEEKIMNRIESLQRSVEECREDVKKCTEELKGKANKSDVTQRLEQLSAKMDSELTRLKSEYRDGFESVKESINTTNRLVNGKVKLVKDELTRDISNVKKMIVLI